MFFTTASDTNSIIINVVTSYTFWIFIVGCINIINSLYKHNTSLILFSFELESLTVLHPPYHADESCPTQVTPRHVTSERQIRWSRTITPSHHALCYWAGVEPALWIISDSNRWPSGYEPDALTNWANDPGITIATAVPGGLAVLANGTNYGENWACWIRTNVMQESKSCALTAWRMPIIFIDYSLFTSLADAYSQVQLC